MKSALNISVFLLGNIVGQLNLLCFAQEKTNHSSNKINENSILKDTNTTKKVKDYILLVYLPLDYGPEQAKNVREDWNKLLDHWKTDDTYIASYVYPVKGYLVSGPQKTVKEESLASNNLRLVSNIIIRAADYDEALSLAKKCPVLKQGATVEVREVQPRPSQETKPIDPGDAEKN
jgi:hypothetical protein